MDIENTYLGRLFGVKSDNLSTKHSVVLLRWLLIIASSAVLISSLAASNTITQFGPVHAIILALIASNLVTSYSRKELFEKQSFVQTLILTDIVLISVAMWMTGSVKDEFYLLYFLVIMISAVSGTIRTVIATSFLIPTIYLGISLLYNGVDILARTDFLMRLPFFFVASLFYGYVVLQVKGERVKKIKYKEKLDAFTYMTWMSQQISKTLEQSEIFKLLVKSEKRRCEASSALIISRMNRKVLAAAEENEEGEEFGKEFFDVVENTIAESKFSFPENKAEESDEKHFLIAEDDFYLLPIDDSFQSDLYLVLHKVQNLKALDHARILLVNSSLAIKNSGQYKALLRESKKRKELADQLSRALDTKSEFLRNMSHELRTPISGLIGFAELLLDNDYGQLSREQSGVVGRMLGNAEDLQDLVSNIVRISRLDGGDINTKIEAGSTEEFLRRIVAARSPIVDDPEVSIELEHLSDLPPLILDWNLLEKVCETLISNALTYTLDGKVIVSAEYNPRQDLFIISVTDTGIGISENRLSKVFEAFKQIDDDYHQHTKSAGLSLAIAKKHVEIMGGEIQVESEVGKGSKFTVSLPAESAITQTHSLLEKNTTQTPSETIAENDVVSKLE